MADVDHDEVRSFSQLHQRLRREFAPLLARLLPVSLLRQWMIEQRQGNQYRNDPKRLLRSMLSKDPPPDAWLLTKAALELYFHGTQAAVPMIVKFCRRVGLECDEQATLATDAEPWTVNDERAHEAYDAFRGEYELQPFSLYGLYFAGMAGWDRHPRLIDAAMQDVRRAEAQVREKEQQQPA
ncbi:MAG: hypothetical protein MUF54_08525 [Polyangiaceae bacterium]|nr:hypothetical protein [Polyangiaceae bacterium]